MPSYPNVTLFLWYTREHWTTARTLDMTIPTKFPKPDNIKHNPKNHVQIHEFAHRGLWFIILSCIIVTYRLPCSSLGKAKLLATKLPTAASSTTHITLNGATRFSLQTTDCLKLTLNWLSTSLSPPPGWRVYTGHLLSLVGTIYFGIEHVVWACKDSLIKLKIFLVQ